MSAIRQLAPGIHWWTCPHPEYRTKSEEVVSYALVAGPVHAAGETYTPVKALALVDPLLPAEEDARRAPLLAALDDLVGAEELFERYWGAVATRLWGNAAVAGRFAWDTPLTEIPRDKTGTAVPIADGLAEAFAIGNPRRLETPLFFPAHKALAFGDAVVGMPDGSLRVWDQADGTLSWYRHRFLPTLEPLAALEVESVLVTHGPPVARGGRRALRAALDAPPVQVLVIASLSQIKVAAGRARVRCAQPNPDHWSRV